MPKPHNPQHFCEVCSSEHEYHGETCPRCLMCYKLCVRLDEQCRWFDGGTQQNLIPSNKPAADGTIKASLPPFENLKGAFESWLASTELIATVYRSADELWKEFEAFATEVLTPVDSEKIYLQIELDGGKFKKLDATKLYRNQNNEYVLLEDKRRVRIGKEVAVM